MILSVLITPRNDHLVPAESIFALSQFICMNASMSERAMYMCIRPVISSIVPHSLIFHVNTRIRSQSEMKLHILQPREWRNQLKYRICLSNNSCVCSKYGTSLEFPFKHYIIITICCRLFVKYNTDGDVSDDTPSQAKISSCIVDKLKHVCQ